MSRAHLGLNGSLHLALRGADGRVCLERQVRNLVLDRGRQFVASMFMSAPSAIHFDILLGSDHAMVTTADMTGLVAPLAELKVKEPVLVDSSIVLQANFDPPAPVTVGESGIRLRYRAIGHGNTYLSLLYNRAVLTDGVVVGDAQTLSLTWTLSFAAQGN